ncbi:YncE family protein [Falsiporphyromonas endometrii]|uniref:YncE family protein n=1 Tax=Falsiporphyromonas endometrii TaxID=1387297 RepID=A0ABV9KA69_9PORP
MKRFIFIIFLIGLTTTLSSCRKDVMIVPAQYTDLPQAKQPNSPFRGMYLLNEGNMGSNKSSLDYLDYMSGMFIRNIYAERNPNVALELGDVGNDIKIYGSKMYIVVNSSHKLEIADAITARKIKQIDVPNCRYIAFDKGYAYLSSYVGPVVVDPKAPKGAIFKIDTTGLNIVDNVEVGYQPEELVIEKGYLYVANSGGYRKPNYDNTVSIVDLKNFKKVKDIPVGYNLHRLKKDQYGHLWISSRGNYTTEKSNLYCATINPNNPLKLDIDTINVPCSNIAINNNSAYILGTDWNNIDMKNNISYAIVDIQSKKKVSNNFITDGTESEIVIPYGIIVNPYTEDILITDARNYVSSGRLICYSKQGKRKWVMTTGDIPNAMCFLPKKQ